MFRILDEYAASVRKSVEGLDYYVAEGGRAFQNLESIIDLFDISDQNRKEMKCQLLDAKRYTKADFKVYLKPAEVIKFVLRNKKICE